MPEPRSADLPRRVLGIDPGLAIMGYGVIDERGSGGTLVASGAIKTSAKLPRAERLALLYDGVKAVIDEYRPHEVAVEQQFFKDNVKSAMAVGEARAAAMIAAAQAGCPVYEFAPREVKEAVTGWGNAPKTQVQQMVLVHLGLTSLDGPLDVTDAIGVALARLAAAGLEVAMARQ